MLNQASLLLVREVKVATSKKAPEQPVGPIDGDEATLSAQEEAVIRLKRGIGAKDDQILTRKTSNPELLARLLELERAIIKKANTRKN